MSKVFNAKVSNSDDFYTPSWITDLLLKHIDVFQKIVLEPASGEGHISEVLFSKGAYVYSRDIKGGQDFLKVDQEDEAIDCIITNPPFSLKDEFIAKCIEIGKPWALLLPVSSIQGKKRNELFSKVEDLSIIIPNKRVAFIGGKNSPNFASAWFCSGFKLPKQLIFEGGSDE